MSNIKVLIVSASFFPENSPRSFRATELAKEFSRQGHAVTVVTVQNDVHETFARDHNIHIKHLGKRRWPEVKLLGSGLFLLSRRLLRRMLKLAFEYPNVELMFLVRNALKYENGYDLLISIAVPYPVHWGIALTRKPRQRISKVWVADCGDPFMGQENDTFRYPFYFRFVEKWFCRKTDFISVPTHGSIKGYYSEFRKRIRVIPQGLKFEDVTLANGAPLDDTPSFAYAGLFIAGRRDPRHLLEFLISLKKDFRFHIYTSSKELVQQYVEQSQGRIILHEPVPRHKLLYILSGMHFVVNFENIGEKQTPSKLIDYLVVKRPILSIRTSELDKQNVLRFLKGDYRGQYVMKDPDQFRIENVCQQFLTLTCAE